MGDKAIRWALIDATNGTPAQNGEVLTPDKLLRMAHAMTTQLARDAGSDSIVRAAAGPDDVQEGECKMTIAAGLPEAAPGAVAYHTEDGGVESAPIDITVCASILGAFGVSVAGSHELLEADWDPGCNQLADDGSGTLHPKERCDACEIRAYGIDLGDGGTIVCVSDFLTAAWVEPASPGPYTFMAQHGLVDVATGVIPPDAPGPMKLCPGDGNYDAVETLQEGKRVRKLVGKPRLAQAARHEHSFSRTYKRLHALDVAETPSPEPARYEPSAPEAPEREEPEQDDGDDKEDGQ